MGARESPDDVTAVIEANAPDLLAYFHRRVETPEDAADLLAETLLVIWRRERVVPADGVEARMWMFGIARRVLSSHRRTTRRRSSLHDRLRSQLADPVAPLPAEDALEVQDALRRLDPTDQEIIRLTYWEGFSLREAADLLDLAEGTVRSRHHRARRALRKMIGAELDVTATEPQRGDQSGLDSAACVADS